MGHRTRSTTLAWRHQAITWTNADLLSQVFCGIHLRTISQEMLEITILVISLKITNLRLQPHILGANELIINRHQTISKISVGSISIGIWATTFINYQKRSVNSKPDFTQTWHSWWKKSLIQDYMNPVIDAVIHVCYLGYIPGSLFMQWLDALWKDSLKSGWEIVC